MKKFKEKMSKRNFTADLVRGNEVKERLLFAASHHDMQVFQTLNTSENGISVMLVEDAREAYGNNIVTHGKKKSLLKRICNAFINPFTAILFELALVSSSTDIILAESGEQSYVTAIIITAMVMISELLRFVQETRSGNAAAKLSKMIKTTSCVERMENGRKEISIDDIVAGDIVCVCTRTECRCPPSCQS